MISLKVRDVMTQEVVTVEPETPLKDVARLMIEYGVSGIPVVDPTGLVVGVVSEADLLVKERGEDGLSRRPLAWLLGESKQAERELVKIKAVAARDAMTRPAVTIGPDRPLREAADLMIRDRVNRLPVVGRAGRLVGIVTRADVVRAFSRPDAEIAGIVRDEIVVRTMWIDPADIEVAVTDGVVRLEGQVDRRSTARILERLAGQVDGVVAVDDRLSWRFDDHDVQPEPRDLVHRTGRR
jgi:CBS domain-containing protein